MFVKHYMISSTRTAQWAVGLVLVAGLLWAAGSPAQAQAPVESRLEGRITVSDTIDATGDYSGFEVLVAALGTGGIDTLGHAVTERSGAFEMEVRAPERGIYPLIIQRRGQTLHNGQLVVADGEAASFSIELPTRRQLLIRSPENAALLAYRNARAQHNQTLLRTLSDSTTTEQEQELEMSIRRTADLLWSFEDTYPGTLGAELAAAEAVVMLGSWDDSLLVARAREISPENPRFVEVAQAARQAMARYEGQEAALALVRDFREQALSEEQRAALQAEIVRAHVDSLQQQEALQAARVLAEEYPDGRWAEWAERASYEIEHLMPGMPAPSFAVTTLQGEEVSLEGLRGRPVLLEFYTPADATYREQLPRRNALANVQEGGVPLEIVSVSFEPDTLMNEAFLDGRDLPGKHVVAPEGPESSIAKAYNVTTVPTRFLIDAEGRIVGKYVGGSLPSLREDLIRLQESISGAG